MEEVTYTAGWLLPKGINVEPQEIMVPSNAGMIADLIGCDLIDAVRSTVGHRQTGESAIVVGYVDDEGLLKNPEMSELNHLAMTLFGNDAIVGDVVVVCGTNAAGSYDGHNHDLPEWFTAMGDDLVELAAAQFNESMRLMLSLLAAVEAGVVDRAEVQAELDRDSSVPSAEFAELLHVSTNYAEMLLATDDDDPIIGIVEGCERLLEGEE